MGAVAVTTNTRSAPDEMRYFSEDSRPAAITEPRFAEMIAACAPQLSWQAVVDHNAGEKGASERAGEQGAAARDDDSFASLAGDPGEFSPACVRPDDPDERAIHVRYDLETEGGALDSRERAVGGASQCRARGSAPERLSPHLPAALSRERARLSDARQHVGRRALRPGAEMVHEPVLGYLRAARLHLGIPDGPVFTARWQRARPERYRRATTIGYSAPGSAIRPSIVRSA